VNTSGELHSRGEANVLGVMSWWKWIKFPKQINRHWTCEILWEKNTKRKREKKKKIM